MYERHTTTAETVYGKLGLSDDKQSIEVSESRREGGVTTDTSLGDTLKLVNQDTTNATKNFTATYDGASYTVTEALGGTKGTVNVNGVHGGATETVTLGTHTGFELGDGATALNFTDVTVTGTNGIATVTNGDATIGVTDSIINGTITGTAPFAMTTSGTSELNGAVTNATITNSGTLTTTAENISASTLTNNSTLNLSGALSDTILGTGTTKINTALTLNSGATINGALNMNNGTLTVSTDAITTHNIQSLSGNGNLEIDYDGTNIDKINLTSDTSTPAILTITQFNNTSGNFDEFEKQILTGANANTVLAISDEIIAQYTGTNNVDKQQTKDLTVPTINWNDKYGIEKWTETYTSSISVSGSSEGLSDSLKYSSVKTSESEHIFDPEADNLSLINQYKG